MKLTPGVPQVKNQFPDLFDKSELTARVAESEEKYPTRDSDFPKFPTPTFQNFRLRPFQYFRLRLLNIKGMQFDC